MAAALGPDCAGFSDALRRELRYLAGHRPELLLITVLPLLMLALLAWLLSDAVIRKLPVAVVDQDRSGLSRELNRRLDASPGLAVVARPDDLEAAFSLVRRMQVYAVVYIPAQSSRDAVRGAGTVFSYYNASYLTAGQGASRDIAAAIGAFNQRVMAAPLARPGAASVLHGPAVVLQSSILFNSGRSFEHYLLGLLFPAVLHLVAALAMVSSLGREMRDGAGARWLSGQASVLARVGGKLFPYVLLFTGYGVAGLGYLATVRGGGIAGSALILLLGQAGLFAATAGISVLLVGLTRDMGSALSACGLYIGTALAFSGATFPVIDAPAFTRVWNALLPLTAYVKLQAQQVDMGAPWPDSVRWLLVLAGFVLVAGGLGLRRYGAAVRATGAGA
ncbi:ABC transporter permease [Pseudoxanthomonas winnipegensis]|jgi:ABC-2 type transport system permease protein|uniref:ABC transporter permease n=1 Tax=Pseudoxanthomonas winnipegensis TaxID=2480810 RepID=A0A4Q8L4N4_9GAMM|nr:ABC transporter permease [Pseudoxanthomonas winnipegensis]PZP59170.1 MAG: ABC transporter permease [Pseudoxanthomonas spadix]TAA20120.1 ABC transporter permease [Pseudoxanthomonas winnipegensis]